jgi:hypothetical protein
VRGLSAEEYVKGVLSCNRTVLARAITLVESNAPKHFALGQEIVRQGLHVDGGDCRDPLGFELVDLNCVRGFIHFRPQAD